MLNKDYKEMLQCLADEGVKFLLVGDLQKDDTIFQIGVAPRRIDIITGASGLHFEDAFARSAKVDIEGIQVRIPSVDDLIRKQESVRKDEGSGGRRGIGIL